MRARQPEARPFSSGVEEGAVLGPPRVQVVEGHQGISRGAEGGGRGGRGRC